MNRNYSDLCRSLEGLPPTWYPGLLAWLVQASYEAGVWQPGGAGKLVAHVERVIAGEPISSSLAAMALASSATDTPDGPDPERADRLQALEDLGNSELERLGLKPKP